MKIMSESWKTKLCLHKVRLMNTLDQDWSKEKGNARKLGEELILEYVNNQCTMCESKKNLTIHHLIRRYNKIVLQDLSRYYSQRYYWANLTVLCEDCHKKVDNLDPYRPMRTKN